MSWSHSCSRHETNFWQQSCNYLMFWLRMSVKGSNLKRCPPILTSCSVRTEFLRGICSRSETKWTHWQLTNLNWLSCCRRSNLIRIKVQMKMFLIKMKWSSLCSHMNRSRRHLWWNSTNSKLITTTWRELSTTSSRRRRKQTTGSSKLRK